MRFTEREAALYHELFEPHALSKREYRELLDAGTEWQSCALEPVDGAGGAAHWSNLSSALTLEGKPSSRLILLTKGRCTVLRGGACVAELHAGDLVGESSFVSLVERSRRDGGAAVAIATVVPCGGVEYVSWPSRRLASHVAKSSYAKACLLTVIAASQAVKLERASERGAEVERELKRKLA